MSSFSATPALQRGVETPPTSRPRLFARTSVDRKSPPPPARLAPITPVTSSAETASHLLEEEESQRATQKTQAGHAHRHRIEGAEEDVTWEQERTVAQSKMLWVAAGNSSVPSSQVSGVPLSCGGGDAGKANKTAYNRNVLLSVRTTHSGVAANTTNAAAAADKSPSPSSPVEPLLRQKVMLTPPRSGSGNNTGAAREGSAATKQPTTAEWTGQGRMESMLTTKRERFISSADTQHSIASSSTPPPRTKRAVSDSHKTKPGTTESDAAVSADGHAVTTTTSAMRFEQRQHSGNTSCSSSSRGAISNNSSSDFVPTAAAAVDAVSAKGAAGGAPTETPNQSTNTQYLVLDDSVDSTAIVSPDQLQRLLNRASRANSSGGCVAEEPPALYSRRLITAEVLRDWTGWEDLELVLATQLRVDAEAMIGVEQIGRQLPRLSSLKLNGSRLPRLRQLGTGFHALRFLWLSSCHLTDLSGLAACCPALVELYVSFNYIKDVTPVMELSATLEVLDVEGNLLDDATRLGFVLSALKKVNSLSLQGNPLTCEHQQRVREAYAALKADKDSQKNEEKADVTPPTATCMGSKRFADVLRAWVQCLMPGLQTLNDEPMQQITEVTTSAAAVTSSPAPSRRVVHIDPFDDRLAEELRLVESCVRDTDPFDPLLEAVEEANQQVYTRPSTSCYGARPRLTPATAMGASRPSSSIRSCSTATSRRVDSAMATSASMLTIGTVLAGNATASLRRWLATPTPTPTPTSLTSSLNAVPVGLNNDRRDDTGSSAEPTTRTTSTRLNEQPHHSPGMAHGETPEEEDARIAALLADDSEEEEWERYKSSLLLSSAVDTPQAERSSLLSFSSAAREGDTEAAGRITSPAAAVLSTEEDGFGVELKSEWSRLRMRMAKAGRAL